MHKHCESCSRTAVVDTHTELRDVDNGKSKMEKGSRAGSLAVWQSGRLAVESVRRILGQPNIAPAEPHRARNLPCTEQFSLFCPVQRLTEGHRGYSVRFLAHFCSGAFLQNVLRGHGPNDAGKGFCHVRLDMSLYLRTVFWPGPLIPQVPSQRNRRNFSRACRLAPS